MTLRQGDLPRHVRPSHTRLLLFTFLPFYCICVVVVVVFVVVVVTRKNAPTLVLPLVWAVP